MNGNKREPNQDFSKLGQTIADLKLMGQDTDKQEEFETLTAAVNYLSWLETFLDNRRFYHKKQQVKKRIFEKIVKQQLAKDELAEIDRQVDEEMTNGE